MVYSVSEKALESKVKNVINEYVPRDALASNGCLY